MKEETCKTYITGTAGTGQSISDFGIVEDVFH